MVRTLDSSEDVDVFRFVMPDLSNPRVLAVVGGYDMQTMTFVKSVEFELLDSTGQPVSPADSGRPRPLFRNFKVLAQTEYFVRVSASDDFASFSRGDYLVFIGIGSVDVATNPGNPGPGTGGETTPPDSPLGEDIHADTAAGASLLTETDGFTEVTSHIDSESDVDYFRLPVSETGAGMVVIGTGNEITVFNDSGSVIEPTNPILTNGLTTGGSFHAGGSENFIIRVSRRDGQTAQYTLATLASSGSSGGGTAPPAEVETPDLSINGIVSGVDVHGDTIDGATVIETDKTAIHIRSRINSPGDVDVFKLTANAPSYGVFTEDRNIRFRAFDSEGNEYEIPPQRNGIDLIEDESGSRFSIVRPLEGDHFYVHVYALGQLTRPYKLSFQGVGQGDLGNLPHHYVEDDGFNLLVPDSQFGTDNHPDDREGARRLDLSNGRLTSHIDSAGDADVFRIPLRRYSNATVASLGDLSIAVTSDQIDNLDLKLIREDGTQLDAELSRDVDGLTALRLTDVEIPLDPSLPRSNLYLHVSAPDGEVGQFTLYAADRVGGDGISLDYLLPADADQALRSALIRVFDPGTDFFGVDEVAETLADAKSLGVIATQRTVESFLDTASDRDAYRFVADSEQMILVLWKMGHLANTDDGTIELYDASGERVDVTTEATHSLYDAYRTDLTIGQEYTVVVSTLSSAADKYALQLTPVSQ